MNASKFLGMFQDVNFLVGQDKFEFNPLNGDQMGIVHSSSPSFDGIWEGTAGNDSYSGKDYAEIIIGHSGMDLLIGNGGDDLIDGGRMDDFLFGNSGNDTIFGGHGNDEIFGGSGNDSLSGGTENDEIFGDSGNDTISGGAGYDHLEGGTGNDLIYGDEDNDRMFGDAGHDTLYGGTGYDRLEGGEGDDLLVGGDGNDTLIGGLGSDTLYGNAGNDTFIYGGQDGFDFFVESRADVGVDILELSDATTSLYILKQGNDLILSSDGTNFAVVYNWYADAGLEGIRIEGVAYTTESIASLATDITGTSYQYSASDTSEAIGHIDLNDVGLVGVPVDQFDIFVQ